MIMKKVTILDTAYWLENPKRATVFSDELGNEYRITILPSGGISVNKVNLNGEDAITIKPRVVNEIHVI